MIAYFDSAAPAGAEFELTSEHTNTTSAALVRPDATAIAVYACMCVEQGAHFMFAENGVITYDAAMYHDGRIVPFGGANSPMGCPESIITQLGIPPLTDAMVLREVLTRVYLPTKRQQINAALN